MTKESDKDSKSSPTATEVADEVTIEYLGKTYTGEVSNGVPHGQGVWMHPDGGRYYGGWKNGEFTYLSRRYDSINFA